jgi:glycerophosphoryl diester phosphodiesterase
MNNPLWDAHARLVIAHRGNRVAAPENTLPALEQAESLGADALEFDVRTTRDGIPVLMHDATLDRTTNGHGPLSAFSLAELRTLDAGRAVTQPMNAQIPALEQVLDRFGRLPLVIEIKDVGAIAPTVALIRRFGLTDRVVIGSSETRVMNQLYATGLHACASMRDALRLLPYAVSGRTPPPQPYRVLSITPRFRAIPIPVVRLAGAARRAGVTTHVWTVNEPSLATRFWRGGVNGIITDDPGAMIRARAQYFGGSA